MELAMSEDQALFHETTVRFIEGELPVEKTRELHDDPLGFDPSWFRSTAELGWYTMLVPEDDGGGSVSGDGLLDATLIAAELGRHVQPGPFIPMNVVASAVSAEGSAEQKQELLPALMSGTSVATWAYAGADGNWDLGAGLAASDAGDGYVLQGSRGFVQDAVAADWFLVVADVEGQPAQFLLSRETPGLTVVPLECVDLSRRLARVQLDDVRLSADAVVGTVGAEPALDRQLQIAVTLACAEMVGAMDAMFSMTVEYSKDRIAFGRPIGSFQALKHMMADEAMNLEACKAGAVTQARAVQNGDDNAAEIVSMVAAYVGDTADRLAQVALQIHGGIGYTWEHDLHLLMRRVRANTALYGEPSWHRERVCLHHGLGEGGDR